MGCRFGSTAGVDRLKESQFYWWQRRLRQGRQDGAVPARRERASGEFRAGERERGASDAGIELVLSGGQRLRITKGVDEATLRTVLAALEPGGC